MASPLEQAVRALDLGSRFSEQFALQFLGREVDAAAAATAADAASAPSALSSPSHSDAPRPSAARPLPHVRAWLAEIAAAAAAGPAARPRSALAPPSPWQRGCPEVLPGLRALPFWRGDALPPPLREFARALEEGAADIRDELLALRGRRAFQTYMAPAFEAASAATAGAGAGVGADADADRCAQVASTSPASAPPAGAPPLGHPGTDRGDWSVLYLDLHNASEAAGIAAHRSLCPRTCALLERAPRSYGHALFSALSPGAHIPTHTGASNKKLRFHLPLVVPDCDEGPGPGPGSGGRPRCSLRVGPEVEAWREGQVLVFDDSHQHEAWHEACRDGAGEARVVLICDVWHPELSDAEVKFLTFVRAAQMRRAKALSEARMMPPALDFFRVIADARGRGVDDAAVFGGAAALVKTAEGSIDFEPLESAPVNAD